MKKKSHNSIDIHIGGRVKFRRNFLNMSQVKLGNELGISFQQIQKYEKGSNSITAGRLWEISQILAVPISFFYKDAFNAETEAKDFAESQQSNCVMNFIHSSEGMNMIRHFVKIDNSHVRQSIVHMIKTLANFATKQSE